jgi:hypothetical protein
MISQSISKEEGEFIKLRISEKASASQIAKEISVQFGVYRTRNSILGWMHRNKISSKLSAADGPLKQKVARLESVRRRYAIAKPVKPIRAQESKINRIHVPQPHYQPRPVNLMGLGVDHCKFIETDVVTATGEIFCGAERRKGSDGAYDSQYCNHHHQLCYIPRVPKPADSRRAE